MPEIDVHPKPDDANTFIESQLDINLAELQKKVDADVLAFIGLSLTQLMILFVMPLNQLTKEKKN